MNRPDDIRKTVSKSYTRAVEQTKTSDGGCSGPASEGVLTTLVGYSSAALAALSADAVANSFGCANPVARGVVP